MEGKGKRLKESHFELGLVGIGIYHCTGRKKQPSVLEVMDLVTKNWLASQNLYVRRGGEPRQGSSEVKSAQKGRGFNKEIIFYVPPLTSKLVALEVQIWPVYMFYLVR